MSASSNPFLRQALPSFDRWLTENGDGSRGDGFEPMADLLRRMQQRGLAGQELDAESMAFSRMIIGRTIAVVEICNIEVQQLERSPEATIKLIARAAGAASFYAVASVLTDEAPWRQVAKVLFEEIRFGLKTAADQHEARADG